MNGRRSEDRLYSAIVMAFLASLVALGLLGVAALLVAAIGGGVAALAIVFFQGFFGRMTAASPRRRAARTQVPERYVPSVLEGSSMRRRRIGFPRRHRHASPPLRLH
jgi:hypothetical protein